MSDVNDDLAELLRIRLHIIGVNVNETRPEIKMATEITMANSENTLPTTPPMKNTGINTAIRENVIETIVNPISLDPFSAESS